MTENLFQRLQNMNISKTSREDYIRSPLCGYPGNKWKSLGKILPQLPYRNGYCEPFGGSASVLLARRPVKLEIYNDRYGGIVAFYRCMRSEEKFEKLMERLNFVVHAREEFIWCRDTWENCTDDVERAARWYYATDTSFTRQMRNWARVTHGAGQIGAAYQNRLATFKDVHTRLRSVQMENQDWRQCITDFDDSDMVFYLDPPYVNCDLGVYKHIMSTGDHIDMLEMIFQSKGFFALSGYENALYDRMPWDNKITWDVHSTMNSLAKTETNNRADKDTKRRTAIECLWIKEASC